MIEKLTLAPDRFGSEDVVTLRAEGIADQAIADAIYICVGFNIVNRIADALGVRVPSPKVFVRGVKFSLIIGYKMLSGWPSGGLGRRHTCRMKADDAQMANDAIDDPYSGKVKRLKEAILSGLGALDPKVRMAASLATGLHDALGPYVEKVARHAYQVTDEDISALRQAGYSEDQLFEATVSAALGAGLVRLEAGLGALQRGGNLSVSHT